MTSSIRPQILRRFGGDFFYGANIRFPEKKSTTSNIYEFLYRKASEIMTFSNTSDTLYRTA